MNTEQQADAKDDDNYLLCFTPKLAPAAFPVNDWVTAKVAKLMREHEAVDIVRGPVFCQRCSDNLREGFKGEDCGGDNGVRLVGDGLRMSPLALHIVRWHRAEVPPAEIAKLVRLMGVKEQP